MCASKPNCGLLSPVPRMAAAINAVIRRAAIRACSAGQAFVTSAASATSVLRGLGSELRVVVIASEGIYVDTCFCNRESRDDDRDHAPPSRRARSGRPDTDAGAAASAAGGLRAHPAQDGGREPDRQHEGPYGAGDGRGWGALG